MWWCATRGEIGYDLSSLLALYREALINQDIDRLQAMSRVAVENMGVLHLLTVMGCQVTAYRRTPVPSRIQASRIDRL